MPAFTYTSPVLERFPVVVGGVLIGRVQGGPTPPDLLAQYQEAQQAVRAHLGETPLSEVPSLHAWREAYKRFGVDPTKYRSAAEALLRRLTKKGDIPSINRLVDIGNWVSIRHALPVAIFDMAQLAGSGIEVRFASGTESFHELGANEPDHPEAGEVIFADGGGTVYARRWCWRQSQGSAATEATTHVIVTVEAQHKGGHEAVARATDDLHRLLAAYASFTGQAGQVSAARPAFAADATP
jgi:DNA/RNA-binding domain of Phe-tRNA-synthetase-like protein